MIKTNLAKGFQPIVLPKIAGIDLNLLNFRMSIAVFLACWLLPDMFLQPMWQQEVEEVDARIKSLQSQDKDLKDKVGDFKTLEEQLRDLELQEGRLQEKLVIVKKIIKTRKSPANIMIYIAKNMPEDLWLTELIIDKDKFSLSGRSLSYKSITSFVEILRSSIFFNKDLKMSPVQSEEDATSGMRFEKFGLTSTIGRYE
ncbi:MAG: PilN domain-containing protein [Bacteriovoracaceae bacterium]|nr:PilN domain-containing protein [Bacteriovoracaceae bacterium]